MKLGIFVDDVKVMFLEMEPPRKIPMSAVAKTMCFNVNSSIFDD